MKKAILLIVFIILVGVVLFGVAQSKLSTTLSASVFSITKTNLKNASWSKPIATTQQTPLGTFEGELLNGTVVSQSPMLNHFENTKELEKMGFSLNQNLSADGPGSSQWGYSKETNGKTQVIIYSYKVEPTDSNKNEPIQFNCPCNTTVSIFTGSSTQNETNSKTTLANPASVHCKEVGGTTTIENGPNGQYGLCQFEDNMACEEWALYRGDCPVGGVKTTGFDNISQMYCAWVGGQTLAVPNANCTLPNGHVCPVGELYNGTCS